jgi:hypothetical protein
MSTACGWTTGGSTTYEALQHVHEANPRVQEIHTEKTTQAGTACNLTGRRAIIASRRTSCWALAHQQTTKISFSCVSHLCVSCADHPSCLLETQVQAGASCY